MSKEKDESIVGKFKSTEYQAGYLRGFDEGKKSSEIEILGEEKDSFGEIFDEEEK